MSKSTNDFGRNEMAALLGNALTTTAEESLNKPLKRKKHPADTTDVSTLSTAETAALLKKQQQPLGKMKLKRHRAVKSRKQERHEVVQELLQAHADDIGKKEDESDHDDFVLIDSSTKRRKKQEPQIVLLQQPKEKQTRWRRHDTSSSSSDSDDDPVHKKKHHSSSDDDDSIDDRRQRLLAKRRRQQEQQHKPVEDAPVVVKQRTGAPKPNAPEPTQNKDSSPSSSSSSSGEDESSSSDEESSSSSEEEIQKPLFVPKHRRQTAKVVQANLEEEAKTQETKKLMEEKRVLESRALVAKAAADDSTKTADSLHQSLDEGGGATNGPPPNDEDLPQDEPAERDAWEVRELQRLLQHYDLLRELEEEEALIQKRRNMTDEEHMRELEEKNADLAKRKPSRDQEHYLQRYHHRGAFYMDDDTLKDKTDIRHRAAEYSRAATGHDKVDKRSLPKVMQVKKFGFANQNTKYKGLAKEDTTDRRTEMLPIVKKQKRRGGSSRA